MTEYDEEFDQVDAGASATYPLSAGDIKINGYMIFKGRPCKVVNYSTAKTGKHGHAKASITGIDIFNGCKYEDSVPSSHNVEVPVISRAEYQLLSIDDGFCTIMDTKGNTRSDLKVPDETEKDSALADKLYSAAEPGKEAFITVLSAMNIEKIIDCKEV